jgi:hypothetical protein
MYVSRLSTRISGGQAEGTSEKGKRRRDKKKIDKIFTTIKELFSITAL